MADASTTESFGTRTLRAFDLETPLLHLRQAVAIVQAVEDSILHGPFHDPEQVALSGAVDVLVERMNTLERLIVGPDDGDDSKGVM